ncbi:esterase-like activity of phytase family protein [Pedobacter sp. UYEF25]
MSGEGFFLDTIPLPRGYHFMKTDSGPRKNAVFEGLSYTNNYQALFVSLEEPRYEDSEKASFEFSGALTRILKFDVASKKNTSQYAYNLDALPIKPAVDMDWNVNGISEILALNDDKLLVMERAWAKGNVDHSFIKVYIVDTKGAENQMANLSFKNKPPKVLKKRLLFDFDSLNRHIDNFEGMTFGPSLPNGHKSLIFCVDNNFSKTQVQQLFLFEVLPR